VARWLPEATFVKVSLKTVYRRDITIGHWKDEADSDQLTAIIWIAADTESA